MRRRLFFGGLLCLALPAVLLSRQSPTGVKTESLEKFLGAWRRIPGPHDATSLKVEPERNNVKVSYGCEVDGSSCAGSETVRYDGKPYQDSGAAVLSASFQKTSPQTLHENVYSSGKLAETIAWQLSPDGSTLTRTIHSVSPPASQDTKTVFERNGGPTSNADPFIGYWKQDWSKSDALLTTIALNGPMLTITSENGITVERDCDGKDHPGPLDTTILYSCHLADPYTYDLVQKKNDKITFSLNRKISEDGKKMVVIRKNSEGKTMPEWIFEKVQ